MSVEANIYDISHGEDDYIDSRIAGKGSSEIIDIFKPTRIIAFCPFQDKMGAVVIKNATSLDIRLHVSDDDAAGKRVRKGVNHRIQFSGNQFLSIQSLDIALEIFHTKDPELEV